MYVSSKSATFVHVKPKVVFRVFKPMAGDNEQNDIEQNDTK